MKGETDKTYYNDETDETDKIIINL